MVSAPGIGSGLDINGLVDQLVAAERQPVANRINLAEVRTNSELSALGKLKSSISSFQDTLTTLKDIATFQQRTVTQSVPDFVSVSADSSAVKGSYSIEVQQLASAQKLASQAFTDTITPIGTGTITLTAAGNSTAVTIVDGANTLEDIRDAINDATDNPGVLATIVTADDGARLLLSAADTGSANAITVSTSGGDGGLAVFDYDPLAGTNPMTELSAAVDAKAVIDGFTVTSATNSLNSAIEGLSIDLLAAEVGTTTEVTIGFDNAAANNALSTFVNAYNTLTATIDEVTAYDVDSGVAAPLLGDSIVRDLKSSLRTELNAAVSLQNAPFSMLVEIGITTDLNGKLALDSTKSAAAISQDFDAVGELFANTNDGIAVRLDAYITGLLDTGGTIGVREERLNGRLGDLGDQRTRLDDRMVKVRERYFKQFQALDSLLAQFKSTSDFLGAQLANLPTPQAPSN